MEQSIETVFLIWGMRFNTIAPVLNLVFLFAEPCLCRTSWEGPLRHPPWPGPSPPRRLSPPTCLHVSTCVIIIVIGDGLADLVLIFALAEIWSNVNWVVMTWLKMCWSHSMFKESYLSPRWPSWPCFSPSWPYFPPSWPYFPPRWPMTMFPTSEFLKIKEKQKAWKVDNGLRVHEVTFLFIPWSHGKDKRTTSIFHNIDDENSKVQPWRFWMMRWDLMGTLFHVTYSREAALTRSLWLHATSWW